MGKKGGAMPGAGRPAGSMNALTKLKLEKERAVKQRILEAADSLVNSQMGLARGCQYLFKVVGRNRKPELVTNQKEIEEFLEKSPDGKNWVNVETRDGGKVESSYFFITAERPDNKALDSLFNRVFGRPKESLDLTTGGKEINFAELVKAARKKNAK